MFGGFGGFGSTRMTGGDSGYSGGSGGDMIGGIIGLVGTALDAGLDYAAQKEQQELQEKQLRYQKQLQSILMGREDSAMQRRVLDLKAAGLSPVLAAGGAGAGSGPVVSTVTPSAPKLQTNLQQAAMNAMAMMKQKADISATEAQRALIQQQTQKTNADTALTQIKAAQAGIDYQLQKDTNLPSDGSIPNSLKSLYGMARSKLVEAVGDDYKNKFNELKKAAVTPFWEWEILKRAK